MINKIFYYQKRWVNLVLFIFALLIAGFTFYYTNYLFKKLAHEEIKKIKLWAEAQSKLVSAKNDAEINFYLKIIKNNETIPVMVVDSNDALLFYRNIEKNILQSEEKRHQLLSKLKTLHDPIIIELPNQEKQFIYYDNSIILKKLKIFPWLQLGILLLFLSLAFFIFHISKRIEQNTIWIGMAKETAHQIGTPISSLFAILQILKEKYPKEPILAELERDVNRLHEIANRFSKIGAKIQLTEKNIIETLQTFYSYIKPRIPSTYQLVTAIPNQIIEIPHNPELLGWVLENLIVNAIDAMEENGRILLKLEEENHKVYIDIQDNGKGIPKNKVKTIFKPGYSTKKRGWGLGLSLSKRIIESYHKGKIFVYHSSPNQGTIMRIVLFKKSKKNRDVKKKA